jgi:D-alanyl-D-alanine carboxypeptidase
MQVFGQAGTPGLEIRVKARNAASSARPIRAAALALVALALSACVSVMPTAPTPIASEKYAAIVVDAQNGTVLYQYAADQPRYPASLTKLMTVWMLFEALDQGRVQKSTPIPVSDEARSRPPTKIGFRAGEAIDVDTAIRALVIRSANDVATAVAEYLGGTEEGFASQMTARARSLGLSRTAFRNASGLPDPAQQTSARDMARLSMALRQRFPHHYHYFSERSFVHAGRTVRGHNELVGKVAGVDGLKTGYIRASGYNLATSVQRDGRSVVAVVMGGESAADRNRRMEQLLDQFVPMASRGRGTRLSLF